MLCGEEWEEVISSCTTHLSDEQKTFLDNDLTMDELLKSLKDMKTNKSPGCDGLGPEFYLAFWSSLQEKLIDVYKYSLSMGELTESQRRAVISLLHKKERMPNT